MKKIIIISIAASLLSSCGHNQKNQKASNNGIVVFDSTGNAIAEKNMKLQIKEYIVALNTGDPDKAISYVYPDVFEYFKLQYPYEQISIQEIKNILFVDKINEMKKIVKEKNISYYFEIVEIRKKINYKTSKIYIVLTRMYYIVKEIKQSMDGEVIAISDDKGKNWKFIQNDSNQVDIKGILKIKYPIDTINKLLAKQ